MIPRPQSIIKPLQRVLLIGHTSVLGNAIVQELKEYYELELYTIGRGDINNSNLNFHKHINWLDQNLDDIDKLKIEFPVEFDLLLVCLGYISKPENQLLGMEYLNSFKLNLFYPIQIVKLCIDSQKLRTGSKIIFFSSILTDLPPFKKSYVYSSFKKNLELLINSLSKYEWKSFRIFIVKPSYIPTKINSHLSKGLLPSVPEILAKQVVKFVKKSGRKRLIYSSSNIQLFLNLARLSPKNLIIRVVNFMSEK